MSYYLRTGISKAKSAPAKAAAVFGVAVSAIAIGAVTTFGASAAAVQVVVTPTDTQGWTTADTRPGGQANFVADATAPGTPNNGALQLLTNATAAAKAQYMHADPNNTPLADVSELSYATKQNSASFAGGDASYQLPVCLGGIDEAAVTPANPSGCVGFTTLVYEPYQNGVVTPGVWQSWDVDAGQFWSSRSVSLGTCLVTAGGGGAPFYNLAALAVACPDAVVAGFGVNIGSNNPSYDVEADLVNFNGTTYNFEPYAVASDKEQCKKNGWTNLKDNQGNSFKNQGDCVSFVVAKN